MATLTNGTVYGGDLWAVYKLMLMQYEYSWKNHNNQESWKHDMVFLVSFCGYSHAEEWGWDVRLQPGAVTQKKKFI